MDRAEGEGLDCSLNKGPAWYGLLCCTQRTVSYKESWMRSLRYSERFCQKDMKGFY